MANFRKSLQLSSLWSCWKPKPLKYWFKEPIERAIQSQKIKREKIDQTKNITNLKENMVFASSLKLVVKMKI
jgi:hypothetical protein